MNISSSPCPLCKNTATSSYLEDRTRSYVHCPNCDLVYVPALYHLSASEEKKRYDLHQNNLADEGYKRHLYQLVTPLLERISPEEHGIDFGSGPSATLVELLERHGIKMAKFDIYYANQEENPDKRYDFLTCVEVIEHFRHPDQGIQQMIQLVRPGGYLAIMTGLRTETINFEKWHYKSDPTHICYYSPETVNWIAGKYGMEVTFRNNSVFFLKVREKAI